MGSLLLDPTFWIVVAALAGLLFMLGRSGNSSPNVPPRLSVNEFLAEIEKRKEGEEFSGYLIDDNAEALSLQLGLSIGYGHSFRTRLVDDKTLWVEATKGRSFPPGAIDL